MLGLTVAQVYKWQWDKAESIKRAEDEREIYANTPFMIERDPIDEIESNNGQKMKIYFKVTKV